MAVPALDPMEVSGLDPYDDPEQVVAQLAAALRPSRSPRPSAVRFMRRTPTDCWHIPVREGQETAGGKFADHFDFDFAEPCTRLPAHRILAMAPGEKEGVLDLRRGPEAEGDSDAVVAGRTRYEAAIAGPATRARGPHPC